MRVALKSLIALVVVAIVAIGVGCSPTKKIVKSGDPDLIYEEALKLYEAEEWSKAAKLFETAEPYFEGSMCEDTLVFYMARCQFKERDYDSASQRLDNFRRTYGRSAFIEDAEGMYTLCYYYMSPKPERDQTLTQQAIVVIDEFTSRYPNSKQLGVFTDLRAELVNKLHVKEFNNAYTYYKIGKYKSAIMAFKNALKKYPESLKREEILYYVVVSSYDLAHNSVLEKKEDRYLDMIDSYYTFIAEYPESMFRKDLDDRLRKARKYLELSELKRAGEEIDDKVLENN